VQAIYVPADDLTDPAPASVFAHLNATTVLSRSISEKGIYPAVDPLDSTSTILKADILGDEHFQVATQVQETLQSRPSFDPGSSTRRFVLMMSDYVSSVLLTDVLKHISGKTPNLQFELISNDVEAPSDVIDHGDVDMLIMPQQFLANIQVQPMPQQSLANNSVQQFLANNDGGFDQFGAGSGSSANNCEMEMQMMMSPLPGFDDAELEMMMMDWMELGLGFPDPC
jgi:hypothetical protein